MSVSPRVSIGVPVYNGQRYIRFTLDSLLAQTFPDIEIIVTDNCSTDSTPQIVEEYARRDPRVRYFRNETNLRAAGNYNRGVELARGEYFKWNPADDVCAPEFVGKCVQVLDADPSVVLAYPRTNVIDTEGKVVAQYDYELEFDHPSPAVRLLRLMCVKHKRHGAHEFVRRDPHGGDAQDRGVSGTCARGQRLAGPVLLLLGRFRRVEEYLFYNRDHSERSSRSIEHRQVRKGSRLSKYIGCGPLPAAEWFDPKLKGKIVFPEWRVCREYLRAIQETPLPPGTKLACCGAWLLYSIRHVPKMSRDLIIAAEQFTYRVLRLSDDPPTPSTSNPVPR